MSDKPIQLCSPNISGNEWQYVKECLDTGWVSSVGSYVDKFEAMMAERCGTEFAVATTNGTSALHISLLLSGVQPGDEILTSALTFIAPANAIRYAGAFPVFVDADADYWQFDVEKATQFLRTQCERKNGELRNKATGRIVRAILPIDALGHPSPIKPILELAAEYGLVVIQDSTEGLGARYEDAPVGGLAPIACFSFNGNKILTTGGGGMITTNNKNFAMRAKHLTTQAKCAGEEYIHDEIGYNYRLTNVQAAIGCAQMEQLDKFVAAKRYAAKRYTDFLSVFSGVQPMKEASNAFSTFWMFTALFDETQTKRSSREIMKLLAKDGIQSRPLWQPLHLSPAHKNNPTAGSCEVSERLYKRGLSLP
ncbi:MAG: LegC family aminotransferase, partial [Chthoniobacterales bacterium]